MVSIWFFVLCVFSRDCLAAQTVAVVMALMLSLPKEDMIPVVNLVTSFGHLLPQKNVSFVWQQWQLRWSWHWQHWQSMQLSCTGKFSLGKMQRNLLFQRMVVVISSFQNMVNSTNPSKQGTCQNFGWKKTQLLVHLGSRRNISSSSKHAKSRKDKKEKMKKSYSKCFNDWLTAIWLQFFLGEQEENKSGPNDVSSVFTFTVTLQWGDTCGRPLS